MSRCRTPCSWACSSASHSSMPSSATSRSESPPSAARRSSVSPSTSSLTRYARPPVSPSSYRVTMPGWFSRAAACASRSTRRAARPRDSMTLTATGRSRRRSRPRYTVPNPPEPIRSSSLKRPRTVSPTTTASDSPFSLRLLRGCREAPDQRSYSWLRDSPRRAALAFLDEEDSLPPVATDPDDHSRLPPERQRVFMLRRLGAVGVGILILILLVLGFRGCLNARKERAFENYARDLSTVVQEEQQISDDFFSRFSDPGNLEELEFETAIRADRSHAEQLVARVEGLDPPGELDGAQGDVESAFQLRADGLSAVADNIGAALGDEDPNKARNQITSHMEDFLASDVLYRSGRDEVNAVLADEGIGEDIPRSEIGRASCRER